MVMYSFRLENFETWLADFATELNAPVVNRVLTIPARLGEGIILAQNVNPHFSYAVMNFKLDNDLDMHRESGGNGFLISFNQVETQKEPGLRLPAPTDKKSFRNDIFLADASDSASLRLSAGSTVKR